ncbi:DUF4145 domain-containing protein [Alcaligenes faecalis]|uniref:DUF4145 domain-containing protein n=1 Tax=Alcaligenes faecalis TaxID=511 RepID=UPI003F7BF6E0
MTPPDKQKPEFQKESYICPHCNAFSQMSWDILYTQAKAYPGNHYVQTEFYLCECASCRQVSLWEEARNQLGYPKSGIGKMLHPMTAVAPIAHPDLPTPCARDYSEARSISSVSPRGAAALLRLCIQKLCKEIGKSGKNINQDIAALVEDGLSVQVQQALDVVRVIGNEAVHPGVMTEEDHEAQVHSLFGLVNIIVEQMISQPKQLNALFENLPASARQAIAKRDARK